MVTHPARTRGPLTPAQMAQVPWTAKEYAVQELARRRRVADQIREHTRARREADSAVAEGTRQLAAAILATLPPEHPLIIEARCAELERPLPPRVAALLRRGGGPR
jgi:hypothetical protein